MDHFSNHSLSFSFLSLTTDPSLIIVLIVVLSQCPSAVKAKPVGKSPVRVSSSSQQLSLKRELTPAALKMDRTARLGTETAIAMKIGINQMDHHLQEYVS